MKILCELNVQPGYEPKAVSGEILDVAPHLASVATFIVHKNPWDTSWQITNVESGRKLDGFYDTKAFAIHKARQKLADISVEKILRAYKKCGVK